MNIKTSTITHTSHEEILNHLYSRVFHVTPCTNIPVIIERGALLPNIEKKREAPFGGLKNGYFRQQNCVSFFDYRNYSTAEWENHAWKCWPTQLLPSIITGLSYIERFYTQLANKENRTKLAPSISVLFLSNEYFNRLIPAPIMKEGSEYIHADPYIEVGFEGPVPIEYLVERLIILSNEKLDD